MQWSMVVVLAALLSAPSMMAQGPRIVADIPFTFHVNENTYPAGQWMLTKTESAGLHLWILKDVELRSVMLFPANAAYRPLRNDTLLTFNRYGDQYFLSEIWTPGEVGSYLPPGRREKSLRLAGGKPARTVMFARLR
jgi:hypothetical protein